MELEELAERRELFAEGAWGIGLDERFDLGGEVVQRLHAQGRRHALSSAEVVDENGQIGALDVLEEQRGPPDLTVRSAISVISSSG